MNNATPIENYQTIAEYLYVDIFEKPTLKIVRKENSNGDKTFIQFHWDGGDWFPGGTKEEIAPYNYQKWKDSRETIYFVEGEKCVEALGKIGLHSTTTPGGANSWKDDFSKYFKERDVIILPDNDSAGMSYANEACDAIKKYSRSCKIVILPDLKAKEDIVDWLNVDGNTKEELISVCWAFPLSPKAFYGLAGDIIKAIEPHSEADKIALLVQFLVAFGNIIGRKSHWVVEADYHRMNLFVVVVGNTSKGRKGTGWGHIERIFREIDSDWKKNCLLSGLSSGEGLIERVADPTGESNGIVTKYEIKDQRLCVIESEFSNVLKQHSRLGNTLSEQLRNAWDGKTLQTATRKNSALISTQHHISLIGHVTKTELRRRLSETESANGFGNRFLWLCSERSKFLPNGGRIEEVDFYEINRRLKDAAEFARQGHRINRDEGANKLWQDIYRWLSTGRPGLLGAMIARAEAQVMRLAAIYALLDNVTLISTDHLLAALAVWKYCENSCKEIFGDLLGDPLADEILAALKRSPNGLTRTDISRLFNRNMSKWQIQPALTLLLLNGLARYESEDTEGRSIERWFYIKK